MAQPHYAIQYLGAVTVKANKLINSASILTDFPTANVIKIKTNIIGLKVSVNNTDMFDTDYNGESYFTSGFTYIFNKDCTLAVGKYIAVV